MAMDAQVFDVISRNKMFPFDAPSVDDFELSPIGLIKSQTILENPAISLYCLEPDNQQAVFVVTPQVEQLLAAPFYYLGQYEDASEVIKVSYQTLEQLADQVTLDDQRMVLIYSMGRSGTTLVSSAFNQAEEVVSLSEPDVYTQLVKMRGFSGDNDAEISALTRACLRLTCKDRVDGVQPVWVLKFRSFVMELADLIYTHYPRAKCLFLYRNAEPWVRSMSRAFGGSEIPSHEQLVGFWMWNQTVHKKIDSYPLASLEEITPSLFMSLNWLNYMERCLERLNAGQAMLPVRYEDIKATPLPAIERMFDYCGVHVSDIRQIQEVLEKDSQAKSVLSREQLKQVTWEIPPEEMAVVNQIIAEQPVINSPDYHLPGTLQLN